MPSYRGEPLLNDYRKTIRKYGSSITWRQDDTHGHCYEVASNWVIEHGGIYVIGIVYHRTRAMVHHALVEYEDGPRRYYRDIRTCRTCIASHSRRPQGERFIRIFMRSRR